MFGKITHVASVTRAELRRLLQRDADEAGKQYDEEGEFDCKHCYVKVPSEPSSR